MTFALRSFALRRVAPAAASVLIATGAFAQPLELPAPSPKAKVEQRVGVADFAVEYSSPGVKARTIWGGLVPHDELWRTGANAATKLTASRDFKFGGKAVPAGSYSLFTIPGTASWTVILNKDAAATTEAHDDAKDAARITVTPSRLSEPRERMTFMFSNTDDDSADLDLEWESLRVRMPITLDTKGFVATNIDKSLSDAWRPHFNSARYLLDNGGDLDTALGYVNTSISIKSTWWNNWVKAQVLAKQGNRAEAVKFAKKAQELGPGDGAYDGFYKPQVAAAVTEWGGR